MNAQFTRISLALNWHLLLNAALLLIHEIKWQSAIKECDWRVAARGVLRDEADDAAAALSAVTFSISQLISGDL